MDARLTPAQLAKMFPAYFRLDAAERVIEIGPSLKRLIGQTAAGPTFWDLFRIDRPWGAKTLSDLAQSGRPVSLTLIAQGIGLNGVFVPEESGILALFAHTPRTIIESETAGLTFEDFSPADSGVESLTLITLQKSLLEDARNVTQALSIARDEALAAGRAKADFLANISHELRTPLTGIIGFAGLLENEPGMEGAALTYAKRMGTLSRVLLNLVNDVLDLEKIDSGRLDLAIEPFPPNKFLTETVELLRAQARSQKVDLTVAVQGELPPLVSGDSGRIRQVLLNLLNNAIKFTRRGAVEVRLAWSDNQDGQLTIEIEDNGRGVSPEDAPKLFQRYSQIGHGGGSRGGPGGTGLGLAICKGLVEAMDGEIGYRPRADGGSIFWFSVPAPRARSQVGVTASGGAAPSTQGLKVLIVDDVATNREVLGAMLRARGCVISLASDGETAVTMANASPYDVILMDVQMPGMDGVATTQTIRRASTLNPFTPIIGISADATRRYADAAQQAGMDAFITKPVDIDDLSRRIHTLATSDRET